MLDEDYASGCLGLKTEFKRLVLGSEISNNVYTFKQESNNGMLLILLRDIRINQSRRPTKGI